MSAPVTTTTPTTTTTTPTRKPQVWELCEQCGELLGAESGPSSVFCDDDCAEEFKRDEMVDRMQTRLLEEEMAAQAKVDAKLRLLKQFRHELEVLVEDVCKAQKARMPEDGLCDQRDLCFECWGADCCRDGDYYELQALGADFCLDKH